MEKNRRTRRRTTTRRRKYTQRKKKPQCKQRRAANGATNQRTFQLSEVRNIFLLECTGM
jgi:hypothetical protein